VEAFGPIQIFCIIIPGATIKKNKGMHANIIMPSVWNLATLLLGTRFAAYLKTTSL
jgi:hypothetical protein